MDTAELPSPPVPSEAPRGGAVLDLVVRALAQLLHRDDQPARWQTHAFAEAVEAARRRHAGAGEYELGAVLHDRGVRVADFPAAVVLLSRDAEAAALGILALELRGSGPLAAWPGLVVGRTASSGVTPSPGVPGLVDEVALWFG